MSDKAQDALPTQKRRFLVQIRGVLAIDTETPDEAIQAAEEWIVAAGRGEAPPETNSLQVSWLHIEPQSDENVGWPPRDATPSAGPA